MIEWMLEELQREQYREALREGEHSMLFRRAMMGGPHNNVGVRTLIWLGRVLTGAGQSLLARYDAGPEFCARPVCCPVDQERLDGKSVNSSFPLCGSMQMNIAAVQETVHE